MRTDLLRCYFSRQGTQKKIFSLVFISCHNSLTQRTITIGHKFHRHVFLYQTFFSQCHKKWGQSIKKNFLSSFARKLKLKPIADDHNAKKVQKLHQKKEEKVGLSMNSTVLVDLLMMKLIKVKTEKFEAF